MPVEVIILFFNSSALLLAVQAAGETTIPVFRMFTEGI
jgi:hypothetical protein